MFAFPRRYDSYEEYQHERLKREEHRRDHEKRESERAEQREKQRQKAIVSPTPLTCSYVSGLISHLAGLRYPRLLINPDHQSL